MNKMGICPSTLAVTTPSGTYKSIPVPDEIRELAIAYEPVNIFKLLGFPDENVTPDEFKARLEERLKMLTAKKGGATADEITKVKNWLDGLADIKRITQKDVTKVGLKAKVIREAINELSKTDPKYKDAKLLDSTPDEKKPPLEECEAVKTWLTTSVEDVKNIKKSEVDELKDAAGKHIKASILQICLPFYEKEFGIKFGFKLEEEIVKETTTCKKLLEEAQDLVGTIRGDQRFNIYRKFLKTRMANDTSKTKTIKPLKAISDSEFLSTCVEIEKTTATGLGFPPKMINYVVLREAIDPFAFLGLARTASVEDVKAAITSRKALLDGIDKLTKKEKASTKDLRTTCKQGLDEMQAIVDADLLEKLKGYVQMRTKKMALYPENPMKDDEFTEYCVEDNTEAIRKARLEAAFETWMTRLRRTPKVSACPFKVGDSVTYSDPLRGFDEWVVTSMRISGTECDAVTIKNKLSPSLIETDVPIADLKIYTGGRKRRQRTYRKRKGGKRRKTYRKST